MQTGRIPEIEREDMEAAFLPLLAPHFLTGERYFVRLDECSSKDGIGGMGPFSDPSEVLRSLGTSVRAYKALVRGVELGTGEMLHLVPWRDDVCTANEFRMFVPPHGRVQAISQYTARYAGWGERLLGSAGDRVVRGMLECHEEFRRRAGENVPAGGYVLDLHVTGAETDEVVVEPVELNSFGAQLASGSGLFHWLEDWKRMYGMEEDGRVEIRVVAE